MVKPRKLYGTATSAVILAAMLGVLGPLERSHADGRLTEHASASPGTDIGPSRQSEHGTRADHAERSEHLRTERTTGGRPTLSSSSMRALCGSGMILVEGDYCADVRQDCLRWLDKEKLRCAQFGPSACLGRTTRERFCIDRFEYPNRIGVKPVVQRTWFQAMDACKVQHKRLCGESEWTLACEGEQRRPYPYGYVRDATACNIDHELPVPDARVEKSSTHWKAPVDQREASGLRPTCTSSFGVADMTGNVDEWVAVDDGNHPPAAGMRRAALKGGYWGPVRNRCRSATRAHDENFAFYQIGFRCCSDPR